MRFGDRTNLLSGKQKKSLLGKDKWRHGQSRFREKAMLSEDDLSFVSGGARAGRAEIDGRGEKSEEKKNMWQGWFVWNGMKNQQSGRYGSDDRDGWENINESSWAVCHHLWWCYCNDWTLGMNGVMTSRRCLRSSVLKRVGMPEQHLPMAR